MSSRPTLDLSVGQCWRHRPRTVALLLELTSQPHRYMNTTVLPCYNRAADEFNLIRRFAHHSRIDIGISSTFAQPPPNFPPHCTDGAARRPRSLDSQAGISGLMVIKIWQSTFMTMCGLVTLASGTSPRTSDLAGCCIQCRCQSDLGPVLVWTSSPACLKLVAAMTLFLFALIASP